MSYQEDSPGENLKTLLEKRFAFFVSPLESFIHKQTTSCVLLIISTFVSFFIINSSFQSIALSIQHTEFGLTLNDLHFSMSLGEWISQGLMAFFFFLVGLELKREILAGKLRHFFDVSLILFAALGGILVPALFYSFINYGGPGQHGWAIPTATDTAFAIGILALMARHVSIGVTIFLTALSIFDDIGAVFVSTIFYAQDIRIEPLAMAALTLVFLCFVNRLGIRKGWIYAILGLLLWAFIYKAGIHATCAGLLLAAITPARTAISQNGFIHNIKNLIKKFEERKNINSKILESSGQHSIIADIGENVRAATTPLQRWESSMITPIAIIILPLFALFNSGIVLDVEAFARGMQSPIVWGIIAGLVIGKPLGILLFILAGLKFGMGKLPEGITFDEIAGISFLAGIGFTMSLFLASLSFPGDTEMIETAKLGILISSLLSAILGSAWLYLRPLRLYGLNSSEL